ncbi:unnamed protein product [Penicillium olsonii]|nr:unnamed protein product [Penicillium olsonii]
MTRNNIVGFYTGSLALVADAFHYLSDIVGFIIALVAAIIAGRDKSPTPLTFGWQRAQLLGAFFNGVLLFGLGISIFLQSIERFISLERVENPKLHLTHKHHTNAIALKPREKFDLALMGVLIHIMGDCANNVGVIISGLVIWLAKYGGRFYVDPAVSMAIAIMIFVSSLPLGRTPKIYLVFLISPPALRSLNHRPVKRSGMILLQSAPQGVEHDDVKHDLEQITGIVAVHELHIWRLNQKKSLASAHLVLDGTAEEQDFNKLAKTVNECFHAYGIHSVTLQPEMLPGRKGNEKAKIASHTSGEGIETHCQLVCGKLCEYLSCCQ